MDQSDFRPDTRYTIAWRDPAGKVQPANIYVYRVYEKFLVVRLTGADGLLRKITYPEVLKIVSAHDVASAERYLVPAALLDEKLWRDRNVMQHYATSPDRGK